VRLILPIFGLILCTFASCTHYRQKEMVILWETENEICGPLEKQHLLEIYMGPRGYQDTADKFWLGFKSYYYHFKSPDEARPFFVGVIRHILEGYNNEPKIRPFLKQYPVKISDLWVKINFYKHSPNASLPPSELYRVELKDSVISYYSWDVEADDLRLLYSEPYTDALKQLKN